MFRLDYISCFLTIASTVMIGRRLWHGWLVAGANSAVICYIGVRTAQTGFVPANLFCIAMYAYNIIQWRKPVASPAEPASVLALTAAPRAVRLDRKPQSLPEERIASELCTRKRAPRQRSVILQPSRKTHRKSFELSPR
jgi:hypothetical protein